MSTANGYIKLYRKLQHGFLWRERREFSKLECWIDILMEAQHDPEPQEVIIGHTVLTCNRGESLNSLDTWARRWHMSKSKARRVLTLFQGRSMVVTKSVTLTTRLSVCNYDMYNPLRHADETQVKRNRNASETQVTPDNKEEEGKEGQEQEYCAESATGSAPADTVITFPLRKADGEYHVLEGYVEELRKRFPALDVVDELTKCHTWCVENGRKRKSRVGFKRFVSGWMQTAITRQAKAPRGRQNLGLFSQ